MDRSHRGRVARGATLFSKRDSDNKKTDRKKVNHSNKMIAPREIQDSYNEDKLIRILEQSGLEVKAYKKKYLLRRIRARMSRLGHSLYSEYMEYLNMSPLESNELKDSLSINVTRFFRNRDTFEMIRDEILPQLVKNARENGKNEIRIWSAGCAVGAEPYSLAMLASDIVPDNIRVKIIGSDIKEELLSTARYGVYTDQYVAEMHPFEIQNYFSVNDQDEYSVKPAIKRMVSFQKLDLMKDMFPSSLDLILCRNVLIYIDRDAQNKIISEFFQSLKTKGMLILGRTETLFVDWRKHINILSTKHRIYQKISDSKGQLPQLDFKKSSKKRFSGISSSHSKRLADLKNFRQEFEERKKSWEHRIEQSALKSKNQVRNQTRPKRVTKQHKTRITKVRSKPTGDVNNKYQGQLSSYRASLKQNPKTLLTNHNFSNLLNKKTPEEVYRELKKMRAKRKR